MKNIPMIKNDWNAGAPLETIRRCYGFGSMRVLYSSIARWRKQGHHFRKRANGDNIPHHQVMREAVALYDHGIPIADIAHRLSLSISTIYRYLKQSNVEIPTAQERNINKLVLQAMWNDDVHAKMIAQKIGYRQMSCVSRMVHYYRGQGMYFKTRKVRGKSV